MKPDTFKKNPLSFLYEVDRYEQKPFGFFWCGPTVGECLNREWQVIASYPGSGDGYNVEVHCSAMPARFYKVVALPTPDSCGTERPGFALSTGSGTAMAELAACMAEEIATGMLTMAKVG